MSEKKEEENDDPELSDIDEDEEGMDFEEGTDLGELLTSLLTTDDGDNLCTAVVNLGNILNKHLETQNKILVKILSKLPSA
jgi:hypothetical protein